MMEIKALICGSLENNVFILMDKVQDLAIVIDAPMNSAERVLSTTEKENLKIAGIILTHSHWDHTADAKKIQDASQAPVYVHKDDEYRILDPLAHTVFHVPYELEAIRAQKYLEHGEILKFGEIKLEVRHTPGHTEGSVCLVDHKNKIIFAGDTIFFGSFGRFDLPGGSFKELRKSIIGEIFNLPDDYKLYCGHGPHTEVGEEKQSNPILDSELYF